MLDWLARFSYWYVLTTSSCCKMMFMHFMDCCHDAVLAFMETASLELGVSDEVDIQNVHCYRPLWWGKFVCKKKNC